MSRVEYVNIPLLLRPLAGIAFAVAGLFVLAVAGLILVVTAVFFASLPITMIFIPRVKITYK